MITLGPVDDKLEGVWGRRGHLGWSIQILFRGRLVCVSLSVRKHPARNSWTLVSTWHTEQPLLATTAREAREEALQIAREMCQPAVLHLLDGIVDPDDFEDGSGNCNGPGCTQPGAVVGSCLAAIDADIRHRTQALAADAAALVVAGETT